MEHPLFSKGGNVVDYSVIWISMKTACVSIVITFFLGIFLAWSIAKMKNEKLKAIFDGILTLPLILPPTVIGFFLLFIFGVQRPIGRFLLDVFAIKIVFHWRATVVAAVVISFPLMYRSARGAFEQVNPVFLQAGKTIGMSNRKIFWKIAMPLAMPGIAAGGILAFARGLGEFGATAMIAGNIAGKTRTLPLAVYSAVSGGNMQEAYGYVLVLVVISFVSTILMNLLSAKQNVYREGGK